MDAIDKAREVHVAAVNASDVAGWAACFTDDGVQMPPGFPANVGVETIRAWIQGFVSQFENVEFALSPSEVEVVGDDWAFETGNWEIALTPPGAAEPMRDAGKYITVYQRRPDDSWGMARDIWNSNTPPPGMP